MPGNPDAQLSSLTLNKYIGRVYSFLLVYDAVHEGENPTRVTFESGGNVEVFYIEFITCEGGFHQEVVVDSVYLDSVLLGNMHYFFDASNSYDLDGDIMVYEGDFGDGAAASGELVDHTFADAQQEGLGFRVWGMGPCPGLLNRVQSIQNKLACY